MNAVESHQDAKMSNNIKVNDSVQYTGDRYLRSKGHAEQLGEMARCSLWIEYVPLQASTVTIEDVLVTRVWARVGVLPECSIARHV